MTELAQFAGRFHPLLVHFPIALLIVAALLRVIEGRLTTFDDLNESSYHWSRLVLGLGALAAVASAATGWLLGTSAGYGGDVFTRHMQLGIAVAVVATLSVAVTYLPGTAWRRAESVLLATVVVLLVLASHFGSTLTHGEGFLTDYAPPVLKRLIGGGATRAGRDLAGRSPDKILVYRDLVAPVFSSHCVVCHGPARTSGGLRLDTSDGALKGGDHGRVIAAGRAASSALVKRIFLPAWHEDAMPPKGQRAPSPAEAALVRWWVDGGARIDLTLADAEISPEVVPVIEALAGPIERGGPTMPAVPVADASPDAVAAVTAQGFSVVRIADGKPFLHVHCTNSAARITDASLNALQRIAPQVLWLDLGGTRVSDKGLAELAKLPNLTRLHLQHTQVGDSGVTQVARLAGLEYLNLYGTAVTDKGLDALSSMKQLRALYVWETRVTPGGISRLQSALPRLAIESGAGVAQSGSAR